jgi:endonuclease/exonuclease/phosphatase family metal-dependent hydrolase
MNKRKKKLIIIISAIVMILIAVPAIFLINAGVNQYQPKEVISLGAFGSTAKDSLGFEPLVILTWNIGHSGSGSDMDFIDAGGSKVMPAKDQYNAYKDGILNSLMSLGEPSFIFLQEVDKNAKRSFNENQFKSLMEKLSGYSFFFAPNYKVGYVPFPFTKPLGKVESGMVTMSRYSVGEASRHAYPEVYGWPEKLFKPDHCYLLTRIPTRFGRDLVLINVQNTPVTMNPDAWKQELALLKQTIEKEYKAGNYVIAGGDWNMTPGAINSSLIMDGNHVNAKHPAIPVDFLPHGWQWAYDSIRSTSRDLAAPYIKGQTNTSLTDFFLVSPNIGIEAVRTIESEFKFSHHQAVAAKFSLKQE